MDMRKTWEAFEKKKTIELRKQLMDAYLHLVEYNAKRIYAKLPNEVELDDVVSAGIFGLMDAIESYDLSSGIRFETYGAPCIRRAILDELRSMDWVPRSVRSRADKLDAAVRDLAEDFDEEPDT